MRYTVKKGDTWWTIAKKTKSRAEALARGNTGIKRLTPGQVIKTPNEFMPGGWRPPSERKAEKATLQEFMPGGWRPPGYETPAPQPTAPTYYGPYGPNYQAPGQEFMPGGWRPPGYQSPNQPAPPYSTAPTGGGPLQSPYPAAPGSNLEPDYTSGWGGLGYRDEYGRYFPAHIPAWQMASSGLYRGEPPPVIKKSWLPGLTSGETFWSSWTEEKLREKGYKPAPNGDWVYLPDEGGPDTGGGGGGGGTGGGRGGKPGGGGKEEEPPAPEPNRWKSPTRTTSGRAMYPKYTNTGRYLDNVNIGLVNWRI